MDPSKQNIASNNNESDNHQLAGQSQLRSSQLMPTRNLTDATDISDADLTHAENPSTSKTNVAENNGKNTEIKQSLANETSDKKAHAPTEGGNTVENDVKVEGAPEAAQALEVQKDENSVENNRKQVTICEYVSIAEPSIKSNNESEHEVNLEIDGRIRYPPLPYVLHEIDIFRKPLYINQSTSLNSRDPRIHRYQTAATSQTKTCNSISRVLKGPSNSSQYDELETPRTSAPRQVPAQNRTSGGNMPSFTSSIQTVAPPEFQQNPAEIICHYLNMSPWYIHLDSSEKMQINLTLSHLLSAIEKFRQLRKCYPSATFDIFDTEFAPQILKIIFKLGLTVGPNGTLAEDPNSYLYGMRSPMTVAEMGGAPSNYLSSSNHFSSGSTMQQFGERNRNLTSFYEGFNSFQRFTFPSSQGSDVGSALNGMFESVSDGLNQPATSLYLETPQPPLHSRQDVAPRGWGRGRIDRGRGRGGYRRFNRRSGVDSFGGHRYGEARGSSYWSVSSYNNQRFYQGNKNRYFTNNYSTGKTSSSLSQDRRSPQPGSSRNAYGRQLSPALNSPSKQETKYNPSSDEENWD